MAAIIDQDELANAQSQLAAPDLSLPNVPVQMPTASFQSGPIIDPDELAHVRAQLALPDVDAKEKPKTALTYAPDAFPQTMEATPPKTWADTIGDVGRMLTADIPFSDRFSAAMNTATSMGRKPNENYEDNLKDERLRNEAVAHDYPILSKVLGIGGGTAAALATLPEAAIAAPTVAGRVAYGAGTGAGVGALQGASSAPDLTNASDTAKRAGLGGAIGAAVGTVAPLLAGGIGAGYSGVANLVNGGVDGVSRQAASHILPAMAADGPNAVASRLAALGPDAMLADTGPAMLGKLQGASLNSDEGRSIANDALRSRDVGTLARVNQDVDAALGPSASPQQITNAINQARSYEHRALPQIFQQAPAVDTSNVLAHIGNGLNTARGPEAAVLSRARDYLMRDSVDAQGNVTRVPVTDAQTLQNAKSAIDLLIDRGDPTLGVAPGAVSRAQGSIGNVRRELNRSLRDQVPGYGDVMDVSSALARRADAIEQGFKDILPGGKSAVHPSDLEAQMRDAASRGLGPMSPVIDQLQGLRIGTRASIENSLGTKGNDLQALKGELQLGSGQDQAGPSWNQQKLQTVFGHGPTRDLTDSVERNLAFRNTYNKVAENSQTAQRNAAAAAMKPGSSTGGVPFINPNANFTGMAATAAAYPFKVMAQALMNQVRPNPVGSYGEVANVLTAQGPQRDAYYSALADALLRRNSNAAIGQRVGNNSMMAAALIGGQALNDRLLGR